jgi:hypothetical protein
MEASLRGRLFFGAPPWWPRYADCHGQSGWIEISSIGELLHWSYANLAMAHQAVTSGAKKYGRTQYMVRARLYKGLREQRLSIGPLADDERLKMVLPQACCYCGSPNSLTVDHLIPTKRGGANAGDNLVWACRSCNSSKGVRDALEWLHGRRQFPSLLLLRRYLKLAIELCEQQQIMDQPMEQAPDLPCSLAAIPRSYPSPSELRLWVVDLNGSQQPAAGFKPATRELGK